MNSAAFVRLTWKEYRSIRAIWLAVAALAVLGEGLAAVLIHSPLTEVSLIFNVALAAPVFFAVGCAGIAFAAEREEATVEFLRAAPVSARQVFASKLGMAALATAAMYLLLWPMALFFTGGELPDSGPLGGMLGLWLVAALEALAWGTLFSLLTARPLLAICEAIFIISAIANRLASSFHGVSAIPNLAAAPWRILIALVVLAADVYLGLRWLDRDKQSRRGAKRRRSPISLLGRAGAIPAPAEGPIARRLLARRDRGAMLGHLLWQHWRQSGRLMLSMAGMWVTVALAIALQFRWDWSPDADRALQFAVIGGGALIGFCVFRHDQEQSCFRFFIEHNIPPRDVWLTRQLPWLATLLIAALAICVMRVGPANLGRLWSFMASHLGPHASGDSNRFPLAPLVGIDLPQAGLFAVFAIVAYAAGQWASMLIHSLPVSAVVGAAMAWPLCGWVWLMSAMHLNFLWSVAPVPLVLFFATWLRRRIGWRRTGGGARGSALRPPWRCPPSCC